LIAGTGLFTTSDAEPGAEFVAPFVTTTSNAAPDPSWDAGTTAVSSVLFTKVVGSANPPTSTTLAAVKPVPVTVKVVAEAPAGTEDGLTYLTDGDTAPVPVEPEPEPPQPARHTNTDTHSSAISPRPQFAIGGQFMRCDTGAQHY
jgi:hypothetical protein